MKNVRMDSDGDLRCWNCGSRGFTEKRTFRAKAALGVAALATKKKLKCQACGKYNDVGRAEPFDDGAPTSGPITSTEPTSGAPSKKTAPKKRAAPRPTVICSRVNCSVKRILTSIYCWDHSAPAVRRRAVQAAGEGRCVVEVKPDVQCGRPSANGQPTCSAH